MQRPEDSSRTIIYYKIILNLHFFSFDKFIKDYFKIIILFNIII